MFGGARFGGDAGFDEARFAGDAVFDRANFGEDGPLPPGALGDAGFARVIVGGGVGFDGAIFAGGAERGARFTRHVWFGAALFTGVASFDGGEFRRGYLLRSGALRRVAE